MFKELFSRALNRKKAPAVHLLHTSPLLAPGGLERYVLDSTRFAREILGVSSLLVFPSPGNREKFEILEDLVPRGEFTEEQLYTFLAGYSPSRLFVHHVSNWEFLRFSALHEMLAEVSSLRTFFIHDYQLLRFFESADEATKKHIFAFLARLTRVIAPSSTAKEEFVRTFPEFETKIEIIPHLIASGEQRTPIVKAEKTRIIFSGACGSNKGIERFTELLETFDERFLWTTVGIEDRFAGQAAVSHEHFSFLENGSIQPILLNLKPAVSYLASVVKETFSYSLFEMMEAGIPVICTAESGNIARTVSALDCGKVFPGFSELKQEISQRGESFFEDLLRGAKTFQVSLNEAGLRSLFE